MLLFLWYLPMKENILSSFERQEDIPQSDYLLHFLPARIVVCLGVSILGDAFLCPISVTHPSVNHDIKYNNLEHFIIMNFQANVPAPIKYHYFIFYLIL